MIPVPSQATALVWADEDVRKGANNVPAQAGSPRPASGSCGCEHESLSLWALVSTQVGGNTFHPPSGGSETSLRVSGEGAMGSSGQQPAASTPSPKPRSSASTLPREGAGRCVDTNALQESRPLRAGEGQSRPHIKYAFRRVFVRPAPSSPALLPRKAGGEGSRKPGQDDTRTSIPTCHTGWMIISPMLVSSLALFVALTGCGRGDSSNSMQPISTESTVADIAESSDPNASPVHEAATPDGVTLSGVDTESDSVDVVEVMDQPSADQPDAPAEEPDSSENGPDSDPIAEVPSPPSVEPAGGAPFRILLPTTEGVLLVDVEIRIGEMPLAQAFAKRIAAVIAEASSDEDASGPTWQELFAHVQADPEQFGRGQPINAGQYDEAIRQYDLNRNGRPDDDEVARFLFLFLFRDAGTDEPFRLIGTDHYRHANRSDSALFRAIDSDGNGQLESGELDQAADSLMRLDQNADRGLTLSEASVNEPNDAAWGRRRTHRRGTVAMDLGGYVDWTMVSYAMDGWMQQFPFGVDASAIAAIDHDGDGSISREEAESLREVEPDLRLRVQFAENSLDEAMIEVVSMRSDLESVTRLQQSAGSITLSGRSLHLRFEILDAPSRQNRVPPEAFAMLDSDGDGFLQPSEIPESVPSDFSVESLDSDDDGKLSLSEINRGMIRKSPIWATQVRGRAAEFPDAVFAWLDSNQDRFLSEREILAAGNRLAKDARLPLEPADIADSFVVQIARGDPGQDNQTFRFANRGGPQSDSLPPWARHMDSNGDGDISELEFIGTSEQFDDFDRNGDGFIDGQEVAGG